MVIYLVCFSATGLLLFNFEKSKHKKTLIWTVVILLSLLAGFRDVTIGTDTKGYAYHCYLAADRVRDFSQLVDYMFNSNLAKDGIEPGYLLTVFIGTKLFRSFFGPLFLTSLVINAGVFWGLYRVRERLSFNVAAMVFCFMHYAVTYNIMRQWMAMAVVIFGIKYIYDRRPLKFLLCVLLAMCFHRSAFIAAALYLIFIFMEKPRPKFKWAIVACAAAVAVMYYQPAVKMLVSKGILTSRYLKYAVGEGPSIFWQELLVRLPAIALCSVLYVPMKRYDERHPYWFALMIVEAIISQLHSVMDYATRIGGYFSVATIIELSEACSVGGRKQRTMVKLLVAAYIVLYWYVMYIYFGYSDTYPYTSSILGIG